MSDRERHLPRHLARLVWVLIFVKVNVLTTLQLSDSDVIVRHDRSLTEQDDGFQYWAAKSKYWKSQIQAQFEHYEDCMRKNDQLNRKFYNNFLKLEIFMEGQTAHLSCMICARPDQDINSYNVRWYRLLPSFTKHRQVHTDGNRLILMSDKTLLIKEVTVEDGGQYKCYRGEAHNAAYLLDVLREERYQNVFNPPDKGRRPAEPRTLPQYNLQVTTTWSDWSKCSQCDRRGERRRVGFCTVRRLRADRPVVLDQVRWFVKLSDGLPCRSELLPESVKGLEEVRNRDSESMVGYCFTPCPTLPPVKIYRDANGKIIETVEVGKGFVSMRRGRPKLPSMVKRKMIYEKLGRRLELECPHGDMEDVAVRWQNESQTLNAVMIKRQTRGRVIINAVQHLVIRRLHFTDTATYSCWIEGEHIATIKVRVIKKMRRDYKDYILVAGFVALLLILISMGCGIARLRRKRALL